MTELYDPERVARAILDLKRRVERLEEEMDTVRLLIAQQIKMSLERPQA